MSKFVWANNARKRLFGKIFIKKVQILLKSKTIYLIRHGETDHNRNGIVQGSGVDTILNDWGKAQAEAFYDAYQHVPFDKIYTSKLQRTVQSVQEFIDSGVPWESHAGLERNQLGLSRRSAA